jgi:hypothetical protein
MNPDIKLIRKYKHFNIFIQDLEPKLVYYNEEGPEDEDDEPEEVDVFRLYVQDTRSDSKELVFMGEWVNPYYDQVIDEFIHDELRILP